MFQGARDNTVTYGLLDWILGETIRQLWEVINVVTWCMLFKSMAQPVCAGVKAKGTQEILVCVRVGMSFIFGCAVFIIRMEQDVNAAVGFH